MGRNTTVDYIDVAIAANKIHATGTRVTARNISSEIGRGSMATILIHFQQWQKDQAIHDLVIDDNLLDPVIIRAMNVVIATKVQAATADIFNKLTEEQSSCAELIKEYTIQEQELAAKTVALSEMETQYAELTGRADQLESDVKRSEVELNNERKSSESARTELAIAKNRLESLPRLEAELENMREALLEARAQAAINSEAAAVAKAKYDSEVEHRKHA